MSISRTRDAVLERREIAMRLTHQGWPAWQVAFEMGVTVRTVHRLLRGARQGLPAGKQPTGPCATVRERQDRVAALRAAGLNTYQIAAEVGIPRRSVRRDLENYRARMRDEESWPNPLTC